MGHLYLPYFLGEKTPFSAALDGVLAYSPGRYQLFKVMAGEQRTPVNTSLEGTTNLEYSSTVSRLVLIYASYFPLTFPVYFPNVSVLSLLMRLLYFPQTIVLIVSAHIDVIFL